MSNQQRFEEKINKLTAERAEILTRQAAAHKRVHEAQQVLPAAVHERDRLQGICNAFKETGEHAPPYEQFALAVIALDRLANDLIEAEAEAKKAGQEVEGRLAQIDRDVEVTRREAADAALREAVANYEKAVQRAQLAVLSDEVRNLARKAGVRLEEHSPLLDNRHTMIGGYPLNIRGHSNEDGMSPIANIPETTETEANQ